MQGLHHILSPLDHETWILVDLRFEVEGDIEQMFKSGVVGGWHQLMSVLVEHFEVFIYLISLHFIDYKIAFGVVKSILPRPSSRFRWQLKLAFKELKLFPRRAKCDCKFFPRGFFSLFSVLKAIKSGVFFVIV